jgi:hypothetical protein
MRSMLFVSVVLSLIAATLFGTGAVAQEATPGAVAVATPAATPAAAALGEVLLAQAFTIGRLEPTGEPGAARLMLQGPEGETVYFGDRPSRRAGTVALEQILEVLAQPAAEPVTAALVIDQPEGDTVVIVELVSGTVDAAGTVTYDVRVLSDPSAHDTDMTQTARALTEIAAAFDFGDSHLFINNPAP